MSTAGQSISTPNFQLVIDALAEYAKLTGIDLTNNPFAEKIKHLDSSEAILELLQEREKAFKEYRDVNRGLINCLSPAVKVFHVFSGIIGDAVSMVSVTHHPVNHLTGPRQVPFSPAKAIFTSIDVLLAVRLERAFRLSPL
jgi:fungal STAND N-terminal Goodbye domain